MPPQKWALVTGVSAGGMGEGEMRALMERGFNVFATNVNMSMLENADFSKGKNGEYAVQLELDVTSKESIAAAVKEVQSTTGGRLDILINNAGFGYFMPLLDVDIDKAKKEYEVNNWGLLAVTQAFFPLLRAAKGTVVNQASIAGISGYNRPYMGIYNSSKAAVSSLSDNMRVEFAPFDVKVVSLVTGAVKTEFYNHMTQGKLVTLPANSAYFPIKDHVEAMMSQSFSLGKAPDRFQVTRSTVTALLRWRAFRTRYIRRGMAAVKIWLLQLLMPTWLLDRWQRQAGALDKLKRILNSQ